MIKTISYKMLIGAWCLMSFPIMGYKLYTHSQNNKIVLANYNGYMDPSIISKYSDIQFESFDSDKQVLENFKNNIYDVAIVSNSTGEELIKSNLLKEIDWTKFNLKKNDNSGNVTNSKDAKELYSEETKKILTKNDDQLKYGVPYFLSYLSFFYRGQKIDDLENKKSWKEIIQLISKEERFKSKNNKPAIAMIDDARTIYSISKLLNEETNGVIDKDSGINLVPDKLEDVKKIYNKWSELGFNKKTLGNIFLTSNSASLIDMLSSKNVMGSFFYNGDALFSLQGGNQKIKIEKDDFHTVNPTALIYFLDSLVISKNISQEKENKLYEFIKSTFFGGFDETATEGMFKKNGDDYAYEPAINFDFVFYIPTLQKLITRLESDDEIFSDSSDTYKDLKKKMLLLKDKKTNPQPPGAIEEPKIIYESYIEKKQFTNINLAYEDWKNKH